MGDGHGDVTIDYPIIFGPANLIGHKHPLYCNATNIHYCMDHRNATKAQGYPCCPYLADHEMPSNQITNLVVVATTFVAPLLFITFSSWLSYSWGHGHFKGMWAEWRAGWIGFLNAYCSNLMLMEAAKRSVGVPRPNFYSLSALIEYDETVYSKFKAERYLNVPSGHSSCSMCAFLFISFYLVFKIMACMPLTLDNKRNCLRSFFIALACSPFGVAFWIGGTRIEGYWHSVVAVIMGFLLGFACACFGFFTYSYSYLTILYAQPWYFHNKDKQPGDLL